MQARQYNSSGFPYCSPIGVSSKRQNAQTSEALVVEESTETYYWILQSLHKMESRWSPSNLRIVFGDHKVYMSLMTALQIQKTCLLRGDYYHNMSEVFPKKFGEHFFAIIKAYLKAMIESKTEEEWTSAYSLLAVCAIRLNGQTDRVIRTVRITIRTRTVAIPQ
jgi:hypothetical protein